eukprot:7890798-Prorocentrum_lima.AAC.1
MKVDGRRLCSLCYGVFSGGGLTPKQQAQVELLPGQFDALTEEVVRYKATNSKTCQAMKGSQRCSRQGVGKPVEVPGVSRSSFMVYFCTRHKRQAIGRIQAGETIPAYRARPSARASQSNPANAA